MTMLAHTSESPFEQIKHTDAHGDHWFARELMPLVGYEEWRKFAGVIERAQASATNVGTDMTSHFVGAAKKSGKVGRPGEDYRLTRYACYLVAMNGDPRKPEIAAAQTYFAVRTHEAELAQRGAGDDLDMIEGMVRALRADRERLARLEADHDAQAHRQHEIEARVDSIEGRHDWFAALAYARMSGYPTDRAWLSRLGRAAGRITRRDGIQPGKTQHPAYGEVNTYPAYALDEAAAELTT